MGNADTKSRRSGAGLRFFDGTLVVFRLMILLPLFGAAIRWRTDFPEGFRLLFPAVILLGALEIASLFTRQRLDRSR